MANNPRIGQWEKMWFVPTLGCYHNLPIYQVPDDAVWDALNVIVRDGALEPRPGLTSHSETSLVDRPMGAWVVSALGSAAFQADTFQNDAFQVTGAGSNVIILCGTTRKIWAYYSGVWHDITNSALTGGGSDHVRFTSIEISGTIYTLITNGVDTPRQWDNVAATVSNVGGTPSPPKWTDITTISNHIIGIIPPFTVQWGNNLDISTGWPAANFRDVADTVDKVVAIRNLGTMGGALYKERSVWSVIPVGGTESGFFRFELRGLWPGPCSPAAVVDADGVHYYLTTTGRVGRWTGGGHEWVADGIWEIIKGDLDSVNMNRAWGVYEPLHNEVYFFYPRVGGSGEIYGGLVVQIPRPRSIIQDHIAFPTRFIKSLSCGIDLRLESNKALVFDALTFKSRFLEGDSDFDGEFTGFWQQGFAPTKGLSPHRIHEVEVFATREPAAGSLTVKPVYSNILDEEGGSLGTSLTVDLSDSAPVRDVKGTDTRGRFFALRYEFTTPIQLSWLGARLTADPLE